MKEEKIDKELQRVRDTIETTMTEEQQALINELEHLLWLKQHKEWMSNYSNKKG